MENDKIVLICATGRSGSTTMQRIINTIPNSNICGENFAAVNSLLEFYARLKKTTAKLNYHGIHNLSYEEVIRKKIKPAWYNSYNILEIQKQIREMIVKLFKLNDSINLWGFKEIRYDSGNIKYMREFKELFPQTKVIIQIRENVFAQSKSGWFNKDVNAIQFLKKTNLELYEYYTKNKDYCYITSFEKMFDMKNIQNIFLFIGCKEHYSEEKIKEVLNNNIKD
jgi:hypothetical protein